MNVQFSTQKSHMLSQLQREGRSEGLGDSVSCRSFYLMNQRIKTIKVEVNVCCLHYIRCSRN